MFLFLLFVRSGTERIVHDCVAVALQSCACMVLKVIPEERGPAGGLPNKTIVCAEQSVDNQFLHYVHNWKNRLFTSKNDYFAY